MMAAAHSAAFFYTPRPISGISIHASVKQRVCSSVTNRLRSQSSAPSWSLKSAMRTHVQRLSITAMAHGNHVTKVTAQELDTILDGVRECPIVVDFYATWCGPCILLSQELDKLAAEYGEMVKFLKVDTDEEHELASELKIQGLPTLVFVSKDVGKNAIRTEGLLAADVIRNIIENEL
ncbi:hypothetical protein L7F22_068337 [Adiantum nelumboides]|nr:hypothetical protein [Adiantum nelumboides]